VTRMIWRANDRGSRLGRHHGPAESAPAATPSGRYRSKTQEGVWPRLTWWLYVIAPGWLNMSDPAWLSMGDPGWLSFPDPGGSMIYGGRDIGGR